MPFARPTLQDIIDRIENDISTRLTENQKLLRRSILRVLARAYGGADYTLYGYINFIIRQLFASTADAEYLETIGSEYGIQRKSATYASGECTVTGTPGFLISKGTELQSPDGQTFIIDTATIIGIYGTEDISITAKIAGAEGNQDSGTELSFVSPLIGITSTAIVGSAGITGGVDQESDDDLRDRIISRKRQPPHGGSDFDYKSWTLEVSGVTRVWTFPWYQGVGTIGIAFVRDNDQDSIIPNETQIAEVYNYILSHTDNLTGKDIGLPVTAKYGLYIVPTSLYSFDMTILLNPNTVTVQNNILAVINNLLLDKAGPGQTLYWSDIVKYLSGASGVTALKVTTPADDVAFPVNKVPVRGTITFGAY